MPEGRLPLLLPSRKKERERERDLEMLKAGDSSASTCAPDDTPPPPLPEQDLPPPRNPHAVQESPADADDREVLQLAQPHLQPPHQSPEPPLQPPEAAQGPRPGEQFTADPDRGQPKPRKRAAGHGSQRFKNKGQKSDVKALWRQLGWGDKPPWLNWRKARTSKEGKPPWRQPRVRPEHESMLAALRNAQNYVRDSAGNVIPTPTMSSSTMPSSTTPTQLPQPLPQPDAIDPNSKAHTAAAEDNERRQESNPYNLPPHLRPQSISEHCRTLAPPGSRSSQRRSPTHD